MNDPQREPGDPHRINAYVRYLSAGAGFFYLETVVDCPSRGEAVPIDECRSCDRCDHVALGRLGEESYVMCRQALLRHPARGARAAPPPRKSSQDATIASPADRVPISSIMTQPVVCASLELSVESLARLLVEHGYHAVPVIDGAGRPIGSVSAMDLLRRWHPLGTSAPPDGQEPVAIGEIVKPAAALPGSASISQAAALMVTEGVQHLPVVSQESGLIGIVSASDILRWLARHDGYLPHA